MARTVAVEGAECIQQLTGPERERHTDQLANVLSMEDNGVANHVVGEGGNAFTNEKSTISLPECESLNEKEASATNVVEESVVTAESTADDKDDVQNVIQDVNVVTDEPVKEVVILDDPVNETPTQCRSKGLMEDIELLGDPVVSITPLNLQGTKLVVQDDIEVKREELGSSKYVPFTELEDNYLKDGYNKFGKRWSDILKHSGYTFHSSRNRETLRGRHKTLLGDRKSKKRGAK